MQREDGHEDVSIQRRHYHERGVNTHDTYQASSIPETVREEDEQEEPIFVFDKSDTGNRVREEAVVDSGAVECMTRRRRMPHLRAAETLESKRKLD